MRSNNKYEQGHIKPFMTLALLIIMGLLAYLAFDSMNPDDPSTMSMHSMYITWLSWSLWAKGLSIVGPIALLLIGSRFDDTSRFGKL